MKRSGLSLVCCGSLLAFAFGSLTFVLELHDRATERVGQDLHRKGSRVFVTLGRSQKKETPGTKTSFFYSYTGRHRDRRIAASEPVDANLFHLHSEGKNVEAMVYTDPAGTLHVRLRDNRLPFGRDLDFLKILSSWIALTSVFAAVAGGLLLLYTRRKS